MRVSTCVPPREGQLRALGVSPRGAVLPWRDGCPWVSRGARREQAVTLSLYRPLYRRAAALGKLAPMTSTRQETEPQQPLIAVEDDRTGMHPIVLRRAFSDHVQFSRSRQPESATAFDRYMALAFSVRDRLVQRWAKTQRTYYE